MKREIFRRKWRKRNKHNNTEAVNIFNMSCVRVGKYTYGGIEAFTFSDKEIVTIGNFCSIAPNVQFILSADHNINTISSFPFKVKCLGYDFEAVSKGNIVIDDDVWIGNSAIVLSGVHIGQGAVIAAGAVVSKDVPPYAVVGGVPARVIKYRFSNELIQELLKVDFNKLGEDMIKMHIDDLYREFNDKKQLGWLPKKS